MRVTLNCTCGDVNVNLHTIETFISVCTVVKKPLTNIPAAAYVCLAGVYLFVRP